MACGTPEGEARAALAQFFSAVQERDGGRLYCLMAGAADSTDLGATDAERRAGFERWAAARYEAYESGRDAGWVELDPGGLALVKLFALGRGTFVTHERVRPAGAGRLSVESRVRFGYAHVDLSPLAPGTTFYVCGAPVGRVHAVEVPYDARDVSLEALSDVTIAWTLVRGAAAGGCPGGWAVETAQVREDSVTTAAITWSF